MKLGNLRSILSTPWAIHPGHAAELLDQYVNLSQVGGEWTEREELIILELVNVKSLEKSTLKIKAQETPMAAFNRYMGVGGGAGNSLKQDKFIGVMHVNGPLLKYGDLCSYGMDEMAEMISGMKANESVIGLISIIDSPGGQVAGIQNMSNAVINFGKPTRAIINDGMAASAGYWYASSHDKVYTNSSTSEAGSIGVLCTIYDNEDALKQKGYRKIEVYSRLSPQKNKDYKDALAGKPELMMDDLDNYAKEFHKHVESRRVLKDKKVLEGAMYLSAHAEDAGLIDGMKPFGDVAQEIIDEYESSTRNSNKDTMELQNFNTVKGIAAEAVKPDDVKAINAALVAEGITGVELIVKGSNAAPVPVADSLGAMSADERTALNTAIKDKNLQVVAADATVLDATEKVSYDAWKKAAADAHTDDKGKNDVFEGADGDLAAAVKSEMDYVKEKLGH